MALAAKSAAKSLLSESVLNHSYRVYYLAKAMAAKWDVPIDDELDALLLTVSLLHDLNLQSPTPGRCFAVEGGFRAMQIVQEAGASDALAEYIGASIGLHMNIHRNDSYRRGLAEPVMFVAWGGLVDVYGQMKVQFDPGWVTELLDPKDGYPRLGFKEVAIEAMTAEAEAVEGGRVHWLVTGGNIANWIRDAPWDE
ncbi:phosphohydrolase [Nocardia sp. NPDC052566]|uniref:phosphohydrolase n=1 Tax=Nocardia sp. NPDC052566 TaxID=3364330 RepID=UPI0037C97B13